ncbi:AAA family ATPase [Litoreibacter arenae]|uniref:Type II/IV secretion system ATPase TadZ/CpaE, associated with Flp pilus assembly n=1 Tax=Litoreibacter arenae DSM 19593 TaxID=1123360 RepID=S9QMH1_9RHOB|nr:AAA family ATPase [Litoreibacter arenae]EPX80788.1 Type II/IV secretion system ATPase TadZ/CpaE, associated with Flp pilus assembly [Litoreibacter arenae DSM 19593]
MTSSVALQTEPAPITACTVARDVQNFDLLIEDMETELGEAWGDLSFEDANAYLSQPDASQLEFIAVAVDSSDEDALTLVGDVIGRAKEVGVKVILIAEDVSPIALHQLLKLGADDFVPYPLPEGALHDSIERIKKPVVLAEVAQTPAEPQTAHVATGKVGTNDGVVLPIHGLAGGSGASTFAVNLAWELATVDKKSDVSVCLLDLDFQFGSASTYLDLPRRDAVLEMLSDIESMDDDAFRATLLTFNDKVQVLTAPADMIPLDMIGPDDIEKLVATARRNFDYVIIDMPTTLVQWTETVLGMSDVYFGMLELDMRSAQNTIRMIRALKSEDLPYEKIRYVLNRAPKFTDLSGKSRAKRMAESLDISIELHMPDGGKQVAQSCDHGLPLVDTAAKNPLRKEIAKLALSLHETNQAEATG